MRRKEGGGGWRKVEEGGGGWRKSDREVGESERGDEEEKVRGSTGVSEDKRVR